MITHEIFRDTSALTDAYIEAAQKGYSYISEAVLLEACDALAKEVDNSLVLPTGEEMYASKLAMHSIKSTLHRWPKMLRKTFPALSKRYATTIAAHDFEITDGSFAIEADKPTNLFAAAVLLRGSVLVAVSQQKESSYNRVGEFIIDKPGGVVLIASPEVTQSDAVHARMLPLDNGVCLIARSVIAPEYKRQAPDNF